MTETCSAFRGVWLEPVCQCWAASLKLVVTHACKEAVIRELLDPGLDIQGYDSYDVPAIQVIPDPQEHDASVELEEEDEEDEGGTTPEAWWSWLYAFILCSILKIGLERRRDAHPR